MSEYSKPLCTDKLGFDKVQLESATKGELYAQLKTVLLNLERGLKIDLVYSPEGHTALKTIISNLSEELGLLIAHDKQQLKLIPSTPPKTQADGGGGGRKETASPAPST